MLIDLVKQQSPAWPSSLTNVSLLDYLEKDPRPSFALNHEFRDVTGYAHHLNVVYENDAFREFSQELPWFPNQSADDESLSFAYWANNKPGNDNHEYNNYIWSAVAIALEWTIISGIRCSDNVRKRRRQSSYSSQLREMHVDSDLKNGLRSGYATLLPSLTLNFLNSPSAASSAHNNIIRDFDWSSTDLGPIDNWPPSLDQMIPFLLSNPGPCCVFWGKDRTVIYNEPYANIIHGLHPEAIGASAKVTFASFWPPFEAIAREVEQTKHAVKREAARVPLERSGKIEEAFFSYIFLPLLGPDGDVCGIFNQAVEVTREAITHSQMNTLITVGNSTASTTTLNDLWDGLSDSLLHCTADLPFVAVYTLGDASLVSASASNPSFISSEVDKWRLRGSAGFPENHPAILEALDPTTQAGLAPALKLASASTSQVMIDKHKTDLSPQIFEGCLDHGAGTSFSQLVICPLSLSSEVVIGFLVLGINELRSYDDEYVRFVNLLSRQVEDTATSVVLLEKEKQHLQLRVAQAEHQRQWLSEQLAQQTKEAQQSELRFYNFAEQAPVGVYILGPDGGIKYCNQAWYDLVGTSNNIQGPEPWRVHVHPDDLAAVDEQWQWLSQGRTQSNFEWRAIRGSDCSNASDNVVFLRASSFPELAEDGSLVSVTGILMDVSLHKAHERAIADRLTHALDAKRAQENFMDMVSHEMRNPLNAMLQCAEEASQLLAQQNESADALEAIDTIRYCGRHQKQIIDDVLTFSKIDSNLLKLSPEEVKPVTILDQVIKIFGSELRAADIKVSQNASGDCHTSCIMDASRILQVLINLVGNAIKFMKDRPTRQLFLSVDTSRGQPPTNGLKYVSSGRQRKDSTTSADWGIGDPIYVSFSVTDTGPGMNPDEMNTLFARFKQASPRTHAQYGGSGLGLFISRELAEMHGGEIGLTSAVDQGSTFAFYIKAHLVDRKQQQDYLVPSHTIDGSFKCNPSNTSRNNQPAIPPSDITILIVEDNLINQKVLQRQLRRLGYKTMIANQGQEALDIIKKSQWWCRAKNDEAVRLSIVLCDLEMPVMDGMTCVRHIRDWQQAGDLEPQIPVVAVTGNARTEQVNTAMAAGFDRVVRKPYSVPDLEPLIHELVGKHL